MRPAQPYTTENFAIIFKETDMSKKFRSKNAKYKSALCGIVAVAASFAMFASACTNPSTDDEEETGTSTQVDEQVLKNGNFEFFEDGDGDYLLCIPNSWSSATGSGASSSDSRSGVLNTTAENWNRLTDKDLPQALWDNAALESDDDDYVDYNGDPKDLPFADPAAAILENEDDDEDDETDDYYIAEDAEYIANPYTHEYRWVTENGEDVLYNAAGEKVDCYYNDDDGKYYTTSTFEEDSRIETNVLMIHNYVEDDKQGTQTSYTSSTTLTLEANTAAKLSVWVKTSDLYFGGNNDTRTESIDQRGAYISVAQSVSGTTIDAFSIKNINTAVLNPYDEQSGEWASGNNGWVQYTMFISACDYAETTITLTVGLGEASNYTVEGYAFFDDITYEKYLNVNDMVLAAYGDETADLDEAYAAFDERVGDSTCTIISDADEKLFRVDKEVFNDGEQIVSHFSGTYEFHLDLAISEYLDEGGRTDVTLTESNLAAGLTADDNGYVSSRGSVNKGENIGDLEMPERTYLPTDINISTADDVIANLTVTSADSWTSAIGGKYESAINEALKTAVDLPGAGEDANVLLMLSARGAAYEAVISDPSFTISNDGYKIVSFWMKTSELNGKTSVTVTARQAGNEDASGSFEVDSTTVDKVTINDVEDVYNGWVQCYALVSCTLEEGEGTEDQAFELVVNYGPTTIKDTDKNSYYGGWAAVTNISVLDLNDEDAFGYADSSTRAASLSITEDASEDEIVFDDPFGAGSEIESQITKPSSYKGYNGASALTSSVPVDTSEYDEPDEYAYAGLINKEYREAYAETYAELLNRLDASSPIKALFTDENEWNSVFGTATQPLLIVNTVRTFAETEGIYNYGYMGKNASISASSYTAVSVRVKVSEGAVATVYLVDPSSRDTMTFTTPEYTFWYDNDGNVLKGEPDEDWSREEMRANIAYTMQSNGLYKAKDGDGLYANLSNYTFEYFDERADYYDVQGNAVSFDSLEEGVTYYSTADALHYAPHYLVASDGTRVFKYIENTGILFNAKYNYMVEDEPDESTSVEMFDITLAVPRYTAEEAPTPYSFTIDAIANPELAGRWITVNFFIHGGNEAKDYRLELWSGTRDERTQDVEEGTYVLFDHSSVSISEDTYNSLVAEYTGNIAEAYKTALRAAKPDIEFASNDESLAYYEELAEENGIAKADIYNYAAMYYTYTLYDSASYVPFNADTAEEDETGYNYAYSDYSETLALLRVEDIFSGDAVKSSPMMSMFIDYSTTEKDISIGSASEVTDDEEDETTTTDNTNVWLLASSIIMVVAILIAIAVVLLRDLRKRFKFTRRPKVGKNNYNYKKNRRYVRTYVKEHGEAPVNGDATAATPETPAEDTAGEATEVTDEVTETATEATPEQPAEDTAGEATEVTDETPAEATEEATEATADMPTEVTETATEGESEQPAENDKPEKPEGNN